MFFIVTSPSSLSEPSVCDTERTAGNVNNCWEFWSDIHEPFKVVHVLLTHKDKYTVSHSAGHDHTAAGLPSVPLFYKQIKSIHDLSTWGLWIFVCACVCLFCQLLMKHRWDTKGYYLQGLCQQTSPEKCFGFVRPLVPDINYINWILKDEKTVSCCW